ncbi:patatin-like phospholipase family protein [Patescibacteria group bacterium]|nr:patatin-like phospholipase family protein [Patescibacteria group bacterium]
MKKKDIILIIGGGGMAGVFSSGVLKSLEKDKICSRIYSVYAVSVGACTGARFIAKESQLAGQTFWTRFNNNKFIRDNFVQYFFQILKRRKNPKQKVDDAVDFDYFTQIVLHSEDKIDFEKLIKSPIPFYVKVFNINKKIHQYLLIENPHAYEKIIASASLTPLTSNPIAINSNKLFDGDTIPSDDLEEEIIQKNKDKIIIKINNHSYSFWDYFNISSPFIIYTLIRNMYDPSISNIYFKSFFKKIWLRKRFDKYKNVFSVTNNTPLSTFCKDEKILKKVYTEGLKSGEDLIRYI